MDPVTIGALKAAGLPILGLAINLGIIALLVYIVIRLVMRMIRM